MKLVDAMEAPRAREVVALLALERLRPLHARLGLPDAVAARPEPITHAAQRAWHAWWKLGALTVPATQAQLDELAAVVAAAHDGETAAALDTWARRYYLDRASRDRLLIWTQLLRRAADLAGLGYPAVPLPLPAHLASYLRAMIGDHLSIDQLRDDERALAEVERAAPSSFEQAFRAREAVLRDTLELGLGETIASRGADAVLRDLEGRLAPGERVALAQWAEAQAIAMQLPAALATL